MKARVKILCQNWKRPGKPRYRTYEVPFSAGDKVLGGLLYIYKQLDPCLSFRFNCRGRHCGECAMMINGKPGLACAIPMSRDLILEPLKNLPVVKDLVIDRGHVYRSIVERIPSLTQGKDRAEEVVSESRGCKRLRTVSAEVLERVVRLDDCIHCLCCMAVCPAYKKAPEIFLGPMGLLALAASSGQIQHTDLSEKAALCIECGRCEEVCPRGIPAHSEAIRMLKQNR